MPLDYECGRPISSLPCDYQSIDRADVPRLTRGSTVPMTFSHLSSTSGPRQQVETTLTISHVVCS